MQPLYTVLIAIAALTIFLGFASVLVYAVANAFARTRLTMTALFLFVVVTLTVSFWQYALQSLMFTIPAFFSGVLIGYFVGVRAAKEKRMMLGAEAYVKHFAHVHIGDLKRLRWWSVINYYSVVGALLLINLVGLSNVLFEGRKSWAMFACAFGAFLIGTLVPYLVHLWNISHTHERSRTASEA